MCTGTVLYKGFIVNFPYVNKRTHIHYPVFRVRVFFPGFGSDFIFFFPVWYFFISPKGGPAVYCICTRDHNGNNGVNEEQK